MDKKQKALEISEALLEEIEFKKIDDHSIVMKCFSIARLIGDFESIQWLQYELNGYPKDKENIIPDEAWNIGKKHGRTYIDTEGNPKMFLEIASELSSRIESSKMSIPSYSTSGASTGGEYGYVAMGNLTMSVSQNINSLNKAIGIYERRLSILRGQYYDYALNVNIELSFSNKVSEVFSIYKERVDLALMELPGDAIKKLIVIESNLNSDNPEIYSQTLTTCRRLFDDISDSLFQRYFPDYTEKMYKTKSGKEIDVSGDHHINKMSAVIEIMMDKSERKTLIGSNILCTIDWIDNLYRLQCKGVHNEITKDEALRCIIHTYICLGDILKYQDA